MYGSLWKFLQNFIADGNMKARMYKEGLFSVDYVYSIRSLAVDGSTFTTAGEKNKPTLSQKFKIL